MFDIDRKQYIFQLSTGKTVVIFYRYGSGICLSELGKKNLWLMPSVLAPDAVPEFSACMDKKDDIYILYQDEFGDINCMKVNNGRWTISRVLKSKKPSPYNKQLCVTQADSWILLTYVLKHNESFLLSFQMQNDGGSFSSPEVIDCLDSLKDPYFVYTNKNVLNVFYTRNHNRSCQTGYKKYDFRNNQWGDFTNITGDVDGSTILSVSADSYNNIHLWRQKPYGSEYELIYSMRDGASGRWDRETMLASSVYPYNNSSHIISGKKVLFYYVSNGMIYYWISLNGGRSWSKRESYSFAEGENKCCVAYKSNSPNESVSMYSGVIPGVVSSGFKLAFVDDAVETDPGTENELQPVRETYSEHSPQKHKSHTGEMEKEIKAVKEKLEKMELNIEKCDIKATLVSRDLSALKRQFEALVKMQKDETETTENKPAQEESSSKPMLPGAGFSNVTIEYIKNPTPKANLD